MRKFTVSSPLAPAPALPCKIEQYGCLKNSLNILNKLGTSLKKLGNMAARYVRLKQIKIVTSQVLKLTVFMTSEHFDAYSITLLFIFLILLNTFLQIVSKRHKG